MDLKGKRVIAIGERDGVQGSAIAAVARSAGAEVLLELNLCYV
jgi:betaine reductase